MGPELLLFIPLLASLGTMENIGRSAELKTIHQALTSGKPELVAVWGRRRVGKTYLVRYGRVPVADWYFELTGQRDGKRRIQLEISPPPPFRTDAPWSREI